MESYAAAERLGSGANHRSRVKEACASAPTATAVRAIDAIAVDSLLSQLAELVVDRLIERTTTEARMHADEWLDARGAADYLGVHRDTLRKLAARRAIPTHQDGPGCKLFFRRDELDQWRRSSQPLCFASRSRLGAVS